MAKDTTLGGQPWLLRTGTAVAGCVALVILATTAAAFANSFGGFDRASCTQLRAPIEQRYKRILRDFESHETLEIDGPEWNDTLILDCKISKVDGDGIRIRNVRNLTIKGCVIKDVTGRGILLRSTGSTTNVSILDNLIENTGSDGIAASKREAKGVDHLGLIIGWNKIKNTGKFGRNGLQHSIYSQASDAVIVSNVIQSNREGNAISIRSSGFVACNRISGNSRSNKPGIRYFADHTSGPSGKLVIRNNTISGAEIGIDLMAPPKPNKTKPDNLVQEFEISGNRSTSNPVFVIDRFWLNSSFVAIAQWDNKKIKK